MNAEGKKKAKGGKGGVQLFQPMTLRGVTMRNRIWLPPMDTYSAVARDASPRRSITSIMCPARWADSA